jgi:FemAB-related protein (PEP-CTERM system-associated)
MTSVTLATDKDQVEWDDFVDASADAEAYHPYRWRSVYERVFGHRCLYLIARDKGGAVTGVLPLVQLKSVLFGNFLVSLPCFNYAGSLASDETVRGALIEAAAAAAKDAGAGHVELRHRARVSLNLPYRDDKVSMLLDLPDSSEALWNGFSSKLRAQVRRPGKEGATSEDGGVELLDEFYAVFSRNMRDLGTPVYPKQLFSEILETFPEQSRVFVVKLDGKSCAAGFTFGFRGCLEIPCASALREFNRVSVNMLLYWSVLQHAISAGYKQFDFGRSTVDAGTYRFKKQWGARPEQLRWHYSLPSGAALPALNPQNPKFRLATRLWQKLPVSVANILGPRIVRHLP